MQCRCRWSRILYEISRAHFRLQLILLLIGANQRMIRCRVFVVSEQITPIMHSIPIDTNTVCSAVLAAR